MAKCISCGTLQGCSCQLINGRCPSCHSVYLDKLKQAQNAQPQTK